MNKKEVYPGIYESESVIHKETNIDNMLLYTTPVSTIPIIFKEISKISIKEESK